MAKILISNAVTVNGFRGLFSYGIKRAAELAREFHLQGIELTTRWLMSASWIRSQLGGIAVIGVHCPWTWQYRGQNRYNPNASRMENLKGKAAWLVQPPMKYGKAVRLAGELGAEYLCLHPDIFLGIEPRYEALKTIPGLVIENNLEPGHEGIAGAYQFANQCQKIGGFTPAGFVLDFNHFGLWPPDISNPRQAYELLRGKIKVVHLSDYSRATSRAKLTLGTGELGKIGRDLLAWLKEDDFDGPYVIEAMQQPREAVEGTLDFLKQIGIEPD